MFSSSPENRFSCNCLSFCIWCPFRLVYGLIQYSCLSMQETVFSVYSGTDIDRANCHLDCIEHIMHPVCTSPVFVLSPIPFFIVRLKRCYFLNIFVGQGLWQVKIIGLSVLLEIQLENQVCLKLFSIAQKQFWVILWHFPLVKFEVSSSIHQNVFLQSGKVFYLICSVPPHVNQCHYRLDAVISPVNVVQHCFFWLFAVSLILCIDNFSLFIIQP